MNKSYEGNCYLASIVASIVADKKIDQNYVKAAIAVFGGDERVRPLLLQDRVVYDADVPELEPIVLPDKLSQQIEIQCRELHLPCARISKNEAALLLPPWFGRRWRKRRVISVTYDAEDHPIDVIGPPEMRLQRREPDDWRVARCRRWALRMRTHLTLFLGHAPSPLTSAWLFAAVADPVRAEREALSAWHKLLESLSLHALTDWPVILGDLMPLFGTAERRSFAERWTWSAFAVARAPSNVKSACVRNLDENPANNVQVASRMLCCQGIPGCEKAIALARQMPRVMDSAAQRVVLGTDEIQENDQRRYRALLFEASSAGNPLSARLRDQDPYLVREQVQYALEVVRELEEGGSSRYAAGSMVTSILVGTNVHPSTLGTSTSVARALLQVSQDCIALFAAESTNRPDDDDEVGAGVLAFTKFLRHQRLTALQLARWVAAVNPGDDDHGYFKGDRTGVWPAPPGWDAYDGDAITPLRSIPDIVSEGEDMKNCLRDGFYHNRAAAGEVHVFRIQTRSARATLALRECRKGDRVIDYKIIELRGAGNSEPSDEAKQIADSLVAALQSALPADIPTDEVERRQRSVRSFRRDREPALLMWEKHYSVALPERLQGASLQDVVAALGKNP